MAATEEYSYPDVEYHSYGRINIHNSSSEMNLINLRLNVRDLKPRTFNLRFMLKNGVDRTKNRQHLN